MMHHAVTRYDTFEHPTTENALYVLKQAMKNHGKPASIMTEHGSQFYANAAETNEGECLILKKNW